MKTFTVVIALENLFQVIQIIQETNHLITLEADHQDKEVHKISHKIDIVDQIVKIISIETTILDQIQTDENIRLIPDPTQTLGIDTIQTIDHETHLTIEAGIVLTIRKEVIQRIEINVIKTIDHEIIQTTDQIIKDPITITIKINHVITRKLESKTITIIKIIIPNPFIGITTVTPIPNTSIEATHQNIKGKLIKYKQLKKQFQTPLVSIVQRVLNYN